MTNETLIPGSRAAIDAGCTCPILDNRHGKGAEIRYRVMEDMGNEVLHGTLLFWHSSDCPIHGSKANPQ